MHSSYRVRCYCVGSALTMGIVDEDIVHGPCLVRHRRDHHRARAAQAGRAALAGPVPVPRREVAVVLGQPGGRPLLLLRVLVPRATSSPSSARSTTSTSWVRSRSWRASAGVTLRYTIRASGEGRKRRRQVCSMPSRRGRVVPRAAAVVARRRRRPAVTCGREGSTATRCASTGSGGRRKAGTSWPGR